MFQKLISNEVVSNLETLKRNAEFLNEIVQSLKQTYKVETVSDRRRKQYEIAVEIGEDGNSYFRRKNLEFSVSPKGITVSSTVYYVHLKYLNMEQCYD